MMQMAESNNGIAPEEYSSRKHHSLAEQALNKRLIFDILCVGKQNAIDTAVNLRSNYDLVVHSGASVALQRQCMPELPIVCMFTTLQDMTHTIRTSYGTSNVTWGGTNLWAFPFDHPPQGLGQGTNGAAPAIWALVSTPVLNMLREQEFGAAFRLAISGRAINLVGYAFVDDSDIIQTAAIGDTDIAAVFDKAQDGINTCIGGMKATGGQVRLDKCEYCKIAFEWKNDKWRYVKKHPTDRQLYIQESPTKRNTIYQFDPYEAAETLGIWLAPDGNNQRAIKEMTITSKTWADRVCLVGYLSPNEPWLSYSSVVSKTLEYPPIGATTLSKAQCDTIERPIVKQLLASSNMLRTFPQAVLNGPRHINGSMGRQPLYDRQGQQHICQLLKHGTQLSVTGELLHTLIELHNLELGIATPMLKADYKKYRYLATDTWMKNTWEFTDRNNITVIDVVPNLKLQCINDSFLMARFAEHGFSGSDLAKLKFCRLYLLQVCTISDIASGDGKHVLPYILNCTKDLQQSTPYTWPRAERPSAKVRTLWLQTLRATLGLPSTGNGHQLRQSLGA
jgi:hypothetical protein